MTNPFQQLNDDVKRFGQTVETIMRPPVTGTSIAIRVALLSLDGVQEVLVEGPMDRKIVQPGHVRITVHGGVAEDIANRLFDVLPFNCATDGFTGAESETGLWYWFDLVEPSVRPEPPRYPWYWRLWNWLRGGAR